MSLYTKYRPKTLDEVAGNEAVVASLRSPKVKESHAHLFHGPAGTGKTTMGRILASLLGCKGADYMELDIADLRGIETIRTIRRQVEFPPMESPCRVWLLDECHQLTGEAANGLLKVLEEPPSHVYFILCTTAPHKLLPTIRSRCSEHVTAPLSEEQMMRLLRYVVREEGGQLAKAIYKQIVRDSLGHPRKALTILEQVLGLPEDKQASIASKAAAEVSQVLELCRALLKPSPSWKEVRRILAGLENEEPESIRRQVLGYCASVLMKGDSTQAGLVMELFMSPWYDNPKPQMIFACFSVTNGDHG